MSPDEYYFSSRYFKLVMIKCIPNSEFIKYIIAGSIAFICDFSILYICTELIGLHYLVSSFLGYGVGLTISYFLNVTWVFKYRKYDRRIVEFSIFNAIVIAGLLFNEIILYVAVNSFEVHYLYGKIASGFIIFLFNYFAKKLLLFNKEKDYLSHNVSEVNK
jgi:putative flippase GtrA